MNEKLDFLKREAQRLGVAIIGATVLDDPRFSTCSGAGGPEHHHYGDGGLLEHTFEVWNLMRSSVNALNVTNLNHKELFLSAIFHDAGKMWDYEIRDGVWKTAPHKYIIHHIPRSAIVWSQALDVLRRREDIVQDCAVYQLEDAVLHNILSHHGRLEWRSPVEPQTRSAWLLHLCDMLSARMRDNNAK
jgi:3'-5' exoribonuclease